MTSGIARIAQKQENEHPLAKVVKETMNGITIEDTKTDNDAITFGKHKGMRWVDLDQSYVEWVAKNSSVAKYKDIAKAELERRTTKTNEEVVPF